MEMRNDYFQTGFPNTSPFISHMVGVTPHIHGITYIPTESVLLLTPHIVDKVKVHIYISPVKETYYASFYNM